MTRLPGRRLSKPLQVGPNLAGNIVAQECYPCRYSKRTEDRVDAFPSPRFDTAERIHPSAPGPESGTPDRGGRLVGCPAGGLRARERGGDALIHEQIVE